MNNAMDTIRRIETLERIGKELCPYAASLPPDQHLVDGPEFHRWRIEVSKLFFTALGSSNYYYQSFWKTVSKPSLKDVGEGLRLLALVRHELEEILPRDSPICPLNEEAPSQEFVTDR